MGSEHVASRPVFGNQGVSAPAVGNTTATGAPPTPGTAGYTFTWDWTSGALNPFGGGFGGNQATLFIFNYDGNNYYDLAQALANDADPIVSEGTETDEGDDDADDDIDDVAVGPFTAPPGYRIDLHLPNGPTGWAYGDPAGPQATLTQDIADTIGLTRPARTSAWLVPPGWFWWVDIKWTVFVYTAVIVGQGDGLNPVAFGYDTNFTVFDRGAPPAGTFMFMPDSGYTYQLDSAATPSALGPFTGTWAYNAMGPTAVLNTIVPGTIQTFWDHQYGYAGELAAGINGSLTPGEAAAGSNLFTSIAMAPQDISLLEAPDILKPAFVPLSVSWQWHGFHIDQLSQDNLSAIVEYAGWATDPGAIHVNWPRGF